MKISKNLHLTFQVKDFQGHLIKKLRPTHLFGAPMQRLITIVQSTQPEKKFRKYHENQEENRLLWLFLAVEKLVETCGNFIVQSHCLLVVPNSKSK